jgi:hypothetical protein
MSACEPRFNVDNPKLCAGLRWKGQFIRSEPDPDAQGGTDTSFWCSYTQTCLGPDGISAEPAMCSSAFRACHGSGKCT